MCGKFTQLASWAELHAFSQPLAAAPPDAPVVVSTPMRFARIVRLDAGGARETVAMRWGFADRNAANPARPKHMHARAETIDTRPTFVDAFRHRRGILFVHTFNEGEELPSGKTRQWTITPRDGLPLAMAVIWEDWVNGEERLATYVQVTVPANATIAPVTDRMPAFLAPGQWALWLGETDAPPAQVKAALATFDDAGAWSIAPQEPPAKKPKPKPSDLI